MKLIQPSISYHSSLCTWGLLLLFCEGEGRGYALDKWPVCCRANMKRQATIHCNNAMQHCQLAKHACLWTVGGNWSTFRGPARSCGDLRVHIMSPQSDIRDSTHVSGLVSFSEGTSMSCSHDRSARGEKVPAYVGM